MKESTVAWTLPVGLVVVGVVLLYVWISADAAMDLTERLPIPENAPPASADEGKAVLLPEQPVKFDGLPADTLGDWPRFRGANFDAICRDNTVLARTWAVEGPPVLWSIEVGEGYAGPAVSAGRVFLLDYDHKKQADVVRCLSLADGKDIWQYSYGIKIKRQHGMSRTVPAVTDRYIVTLGPKCHVTCLDLATGQFRWMLDLVNDFGAKVPTWYAGQCPLIDDSRAIIAVGGETLMMAVDCETGETIWQSPNPHSWVMTHSSIVPTEFKGTPMYVYCAGGGVVGISAKDGSILWETDKWRVSTANVPSPVVVGEGLIFLSGGYNAGSMILRLVQEPNGISAQPVFRLKADVFGSPQQTPIFYDGYIYGVRPDGQLTCLDLDGRVVWTSTTAHRFGLGPYTIANGLIYVMNDSGVLTVGEATPAGYIQLAEAKILDGIESWGPMAIASGRLILRDLTRMVCLDIAQR